MSAAQRNRVRWYYRCLRRAGDTRSQSRRASQTYAEFLVSINYCEGVGS